MSPRSKNIYTTLFNDLFRYYLTKTFLSWKHKREHCKSGLKVEITGALHGLNIGDIALSQSIASVLDENDIKEYSYSNIYNIQNTPKGEYLIVCGGATGTNHNINNIFKKYIDTPENVAFVGMDWEGEIHLLPKDVLSWLKKCHCISSRSKVWEEYIGKTLSPDVSKYHLDNVFSWLPNINTVCKEPSTVKTIGINVMSFYMQLNNHKNFVPGHGRSAFLKENSKEQYEAIPRLGKDYVDIFRELIQKYKSLGYNVIHIPFAIEDDLFARTVFKDLKIVYLPFKDIKCTLSKMRELEIFIASRYHALIFALSLNIPCKAFLYCNKSIELSNELELSSETNISILDLVEENQKKINLFIKSASLIDFSPSDLKKIAKETKASINKNLNLNQWIK